MVFGGKPYYVKWMVWGTTIFGSIHVTCFIFALKYWKTLDLRCRWWPHVQCFSPWSFWSLCREPAKIFPNLETFRCFFCIFVTNPWNSHFRPWKWMLGILGYIRPSFWGPAYFQGAKKIRFRECMFCGWRLMTWWLVTESLYFRHCLHTVGERQSCNWGRCNFRDVVVSCSLSIK